MAPLAEAFGFPNVAVEGFEADDVIATLARQATDAGISVMIVSGDRDVYQLVRAGVRVMTTSRGVTDTKIYDHDGVIERYYAISVERRIKHPAVAAITEAARERIFKRG